MRRTTAITSLALAAGLALAGCASSSGQDASSTTPASPSASAEASVSATPAAPETYELGQTFTATTSYGAEITVEIPAEGPGEVEQLRKELNVDPVAYAKVGIDNRKGTENVSIYAVTVYDEDGKPYEFTDLSVFNLGDWGPNYTDNLGGVEGEYGYTLLDGTVLDETIGQDLSDRSSSFYNKYLNGTNASKLEVSTGWLASTEAELPERITGITVQPNGIGEEEPMTPGGTMPTVKEQPSQAPTGDTPQAQPSAPAKESEGGTGPTELPMPGAIPNQNFTYEEALAASEDGMPYYDAFCIHYTPTTDGGRSQCEGIEAGTVDSITGEYIGG
jgi:hypothetical protein